MTAKEVKFDIITHLVNLEDMSLLLKIRNLLLPIKGEAVSDPPIEDGFDASKLPFEEWNKQFSDGADLDEYLPDYKMTMGEYRRKIYESERSGFITYRELGSAIQSWKNL
ncbi:MAG TPA: hypothetical protein ENJ95_22405 [Bacteroidetes bacterium]|nr:hypothetical protein [Bacteroidota bacterium]